jgi:cob(I)alamin adenosyltransferase
MPKIYTKTGDAGETGLFGGGRVSKDDARVEAYGAVDEANSALGMLAAQVEGDIADVVHLIQRTLFDVGAELATPEAGRVPAITVKPVMDLEDQIDKWEAELQPLRTFILPGGTAAAASAHLARSIVRRAERRTVTLSRTTPVNPELLKYLNRLSDTLFVLARVLNHRAHRPDVPWEGRRDSR